MRVLVDSNKCQGHTLCNAAAPAVFHLRDEDGHAFVTTAEVPAELVAAVLRAANGCPERAIVLDE